MTEVGGVLFVLPQNCKHRCWSFPAWGRFFRSTSSFSLPRSLHKSFTLSLTLFLFSFLPFSFSLPRSLPASLTPHPTPSTFSTSSAHITAGQKRRRPAIYSEKKEAASQERKRCVRGLRSPQDSAEEGRPHGSHLPGQIEHLETPAHPRVLARGVRSQSRGADQSSMLCAVMW